MSNTQFIISIATDIVLTIVIVFLIVFLIRFKNKTEKVKYFALQKGLTKEELEPHMRALTKRQKQIITAYYCEGKQLQEIADDLDLSLEHTTREKKIAATKIMKNCK